jgi:tetratricopeptide (TPR) repeat protein
MTEGVDPGPPPVSGPDFPVAAIERAEQLIGIRRYADALQWLGRAIAADPERARAHCLMALAFIGLGEYAQALAAAGRAATADPHDEWPQRLRSIALLETGRRREALRAAQEAARLGPDVPEALFTLVHAQLALGRGREAQMTAVRLAEVAPDRAMTFRALARIAMRRRDWAAAEAHLRRALALDSESYETMNDLGLVLQKGGKTQEAIDRLHDAVRVNPVRSEAHENLNAALRRFLRPGWIVPVAVLAGAAARGLPGAEASLPLVFALVMLAYLLWRRRRLRTLPPRVVAVSRLEHEWWRQRFPLETTRLVASFTTLLWAIALASAVMNGHRYDGRDWALLISSPAVATAILVLLWLRSRRAGGGGTSH